MPWAFWVEDLYADVRFSDGKARYKAYRDTPHWQSLRQQSLKLADFRCERCHRTRFECGRLDVHHDQRAYRNLGQESLSDLTVLCPSCHDQEHWSIVARPQDRRWWAEIERRRLARERAAARAAAQKAAASRSADAVAAFRALEAGPPPRPFRPLTAAERQALLFRRLLVGSPVIAAAVRHAFGRRQPAVTVSVMRPEPPVADASFADALRRSPQLARHVAAVRTRQGRL